MRCFHVLILLFCLYVYLSHSQYDDRYLHDLPAFIKTMTMTRKRILMDKLNLGIGFCNEMEAGRIAFYNTLKKYLSILTCKCRFEIRGRFLFYSQKDT